jgi:DNA-binding MarR family transcriptional regulator
LSSNHQAMGQLSQFFAQMGTVHKTYLDFCRRAVGGTLSRAEIGLLLALSENCNAANDLCRSLPLSKGMVSQTLASLQKRGLVVVERSEEDRRVHPITLSPQGQSMVAELEQAAAAFVDHMMRGVSQQEMVQAESTMSKIHQNMQQLKRSL